MSAPQAAVHGVDLVDLETVFRESDYLVVLCNLTDETRHLVNRERLATMKPTASLISIARGPIVDEQALYEALSTKAIRAAAIDVFEQEPPDPGNPLFQLDNVIVSPHALAWTEAAMGIGLGVIESILDVRAGRVPKYVVNTEVIDSPKFQEKLEGIARNGGRQCGRTRSRKRSPAAGYRSARWCSSSTRPVSAASQARQAPIS